MKVYVSGPPISKIEDDSFLHARIYRTIAEKLKQAGHEALLPIRQPELDSLKAKDFFAAMAKRIGDCERILTIFDGGDQSTPVEATIAASSGKPQFILEIHAAPRMVRGLPGVLGEKRISKENLESAVVEALEHLAILPRRVAA